MPNLSAISDTIAAISTPVGVGAISIIRISGKSTPALIQNIITPFPASIVAHHLYTAQVIEPDSRKILDQVMFAIMQAPHSYTGEDMSEIYCHGGLLNSRRVLKLLLAQGARLAEKGEFTRRAFLNGKIDLVQAEAISDIIQARTEKGLDQSQQSLGNGPSQVFQEIKAALFQVRVELEASIDFPEDVEEVDASQCQARIRSIRKQVQTLVESFNQGRMHREGIRCVIVGKPNVGKSSIFNQLLDRDRAIVYDQPGTTRDIIEEAAFIQGLLFNFIDTAGLSQSTNAVERQGILRTLEHIKTADLLLWVFDASQALTEADRQIQAEVTDKPVILILNKVDLPRGIDDKALSVLFPNLSFLELSAKTQAGMPQLKEALVQKSVGETSLAESIVITRLRHQSILNRVSEILKSAEKGLLENLPIDFIASDIKNAQNTLAEITGEIYTEEVLTGIFDQFCIGK